MKKYQLYYLDCLIADFSVDGNEVITYIPNEDVIKEFDNVIFDIVNETHIFFFLLKKCVILQWYQKNYLL